MEKIRIENFKKFKAKCEVDFAPITFLTGTNNSGKSTIIKSILLTHDYLNSNNLFKLSFHGKFSDHHKISSGDQLCNREYPYSETDFVTNHNGLEIKITTNNRKETKSIKEISVLSTDENCLFSMTENKIEQGVWDVMLHINKNTSETKNKFDYEKAISQINLELIKLLKLDDTLLHDLAQKDFNTNKIGHIVQETFSDLLSNAHGKTDTIINQNILDNLSSLEFCKEKFGVSYPILIEIDSDISKEELKKLSHINGKRRYYANIFSSSNPNINYLVTNDWYDRHKSRFIDWLSEINYFIKPSLDTIFKSRLKQLEEELTTQDYINLLSQVTNIWDKQRKLYDLQANDKKNQDSDIYFINDQIDDPYYSGEARHFNLWGMSPNNSINEKISKIIKNDFKKNNLELTSDQLDQYKWQISNLLQRAAFFNIEHLSTNKYNGNK